MITVLQGDPENSKSLMTIDLIARLSTGKPMPFDTRCGQPATSILLSAEDSSSRTIQPRLEAAGADLRRVVELSHVNDGDKELSFVLPGHSNILEDAIVERNAKFVVFDPLTAFLDRKVNSNSEQDIRQVATELCKIAERTGVAIIWIRHLNKGDGLSAMNRGIGSVGIGAAARVGFHVGDAPGKPGFKVMACFKNNVAARPVSLEFEVIASSSDPNVPVIRWTALSDCTADDLVGQGNRKSPQLDRAKEILQEMLATGPMWQSDIMNRCKSEGISESSMKRAKTLMGIESDKDRNQPAGGWFWHFPQ